MVNAIINASRSATVEIETGDITGDIVDGIRSAMEMVSTSVAGMVNAIINASRSATVENDPGDGAGIRSAMEIVSTSVAEMVNGMVNVGGDAAMAAPAMGAGASIVLTQNFYGQTSPSDVRTAAQGGVLAALQAAGL